MGGFLISIDGIDGSGKTTQAKLLYDYLSQTRSDALLLVAPGDRPIGRFIHQLGRSGLIRGLNHSVASLLWAADIAELVSARLNPAMAADKTIIADRYFYSNIAYAAAMNVDYNWITHVYEFAREPDLSILLDAAEEIAIGRIQNRNKPTSCHERDIRFLANLRKHFLRLSTERDIVIVNSNGSITETQQEIRKVVAFRLKLLQLCPADAS
ncbi:MAG: dTMP kinase [Candidatus Omnitrophica bacterium]|nr:dTMP kinase [Candidatus Omnitrophota bacterium]MBU4488700.1 dTMP kinase [Candidatus Omnitrophota bacterium]MCG2705729.1 dTMP kinase [Candidatus Omnitrophota bacterium]